MTQQKKKRKWIKWVVLGGLALMVGVVIYGCNALANIGQAYLSALGTSVKAERGEISVVVQAAGMISSQAQDTVQAPFSAEVEAIHAKAGDTVKEGDEIVTLSGDKLEDEIKLLKKELEAVDNQILMTSNSKSKTISSPVSGRIKAVYAEVNQDTKTIVDRNDGLFLISTDERMKVVLTSSTPLEAGTAVSVTVGEKVIDSTVLSVEKDKMTIVIPDDKYEMGQEVLVSVKDGEVIGSGVLEINSPFLVKGPSGVISRIQVKVQDSVSMGSSLIELKEAAYSLSYQQLFENKNEIEKEIKEKEEYAKGAVIVAPIAGVLQEMSIREGTTVMENAPLFTINGSDGYTLTVAVDELDIANIEEGQVASVVLDALPDAKYTGKVTRISGLGNYSGGMTIYEVSVELNETDRILPGMSARADILIAEKDDALLVPVSAISRKDGKIFVTVVPDPESAVSGSAIEQKEVEVTIGLVSGTYVEILSGLEEGQFVLDKAASNDPLAGLMGGGGGAMVFGV